MKPGDNDTADIGKNRGLRVSCGVTGVKPFLYRYPARKSPVIFWNAPGRIRRKQIYEKESLTAPIA